VTEEDCQVPWLRESIRRIAERGHFVAVLAPAFKGSPDHLIDGILVHRFRYAPAHLEVLTHGEGAPAKVKKNPLLKSMAGSYLLAGIGAAASLCRRERIQILHVHWPFPHGLMAELPRLLNGVKIVSTCHSAEIAMAKQSALGTRLLRWSLNHSDAVTANSSYTAGLIREICGRTAEVTPCGVTVKVDERSVHAGNSSEIPLLLFAGRLIPRKGVDYLLRALPLILARQKVRLVITGDGPCRSAWETLGREIGIDHAVEFAGFVSTQRLAKLYQECSVYVHPAIFDCQGDTEGLGVVLIEALRNRKPIVASKVGGIVDLIKHDETGLLVPEKSPEALAAAVLRILTNPGLAHRLGEQGCAHAAKFFDWERLTDQLEAIFYRTRGLHLAPAISATSSLRLARARTQ
jgi:glycosyltransferase involved in cell wall biosynthesis